MKKETGRCEIACLIFVLTFLSASRTSALADEASPGNAHDDSHQRHPPGQITVLAPNGDEDGDLHWIGGVPHDIVWDHTASVTGMVTIEYSLNGGQSWNVANTSWWTTPATNVAVTDRFYVWFTPATESTNVLVRITSNEDSAIHDVSDDIFTLREGLQIVQHNGGSPTWYLGKTNPIVWRKSFLSPPALLEFDGSGSFANTNSIVLLTPASIGVDPLNTFNWITPINDARLVSETGKLRVRPVALALIHLADESDTDFLLAGAVFTKPAAGVIVRLDAQFELHWLSAGMGPTVTLEIQENPNGPWQIIDPAVPNSSGPNLYNWSPSNHPPGLTRLRLTSTNDTRARGLSAPFTLAQIDLVSPLGYPTPSEGEIWLQNTSRDIRWLSRGAGDSVNILFSTNSGQDYVVIETNYPNLNDSGHTNVYSWRVAPAPSETVRVRIEDAKHPEALFSESSNDFQIAGLNLIWPNGPRGQAFEWPLGESRSIRWIANAVGSNATIEISENAGFTWRVIALGPILEDGQHVYTPETPTAFALVRITADDPSPFSDVFDTSDFVFDVPGVLIEQPHIGSLFTHGVTNDIAFFIHAPRDVDNHAPIYYSADGGLTFDPSPLNPQDDVFSSGSGSPHVFAWEIETYRRPSLNAVLRIDADVYQVFSEPFTMRGIRIHQPRAGASWAPGARQIRWWKAVFAADAQCEIRLSLEGGAPGTYTHAVVQNISLADLSWNWSIPSALGASTNARLRLEITASTINPADIGYHAYSDLFSLEAAPETRPLDALLMTIR